MWYSTGKVLLSLALLLVSVSLQVQHTHSANILGVFTSNSPSHLIVHMSVAKALAERGHNVTVVTTLQPKVTHKSINQIVLSLSADQQKELNEHMTQMTGQKTNIVIMMKNLIFSSSAMIDLQLEVLQDKRFTSLHENKDNKFDLVIIGYFMNEFQLGIAAKFNCPQIVTWTAGPNFLVNGFVGNPEELSYVPSFNVAVKSGKGMNFLERVKNYLTNVLFQVFGLIQNYRKHKMYTKLFGHEQNFPSLDDVQKNISLVFTNSHSISEGPIRPNVPALVEIGGIQIKDKPDPLPKDIAEFMDAAKEHGAVFFSLGSNAKSDNIPKDIVSQIYNVLSSLKQNVIWKWEDLENTPGKAKNILYKKWLPQDDILAHPNLKLFITHAGKGGIAEAQYHAVPMVALPIFADQGGNAEKMENSGYGRQLELFHLTEDTFKAAVLEVLNNPTYAENVKKFSQLYRDRPMTPKQDVIFWTEYVLRHHGASHMQSPLVHLNRLQSLSVDVIAFLLLILYIVWRLIKFVCMFGYRKLFGRKQSPDKKKDKSKVKKQ